MQQIRAGKLRALIEGVGGHVSALQRAEENLVLEVRSRTEKTLLGNLVCLWVEPIRDTGWEIRYWWNYDQEEYLLELSFWPDVFFCSS